LQSVLNHEKNSGNLHLPISLNHSQDFPVVQYADDTLIFLEADSLQLDCLKNILLNFSSSTGLNVNYSKSMLIPINLDSDRANHLANNFGCIVGTLPFTYLGLPLNLSKPEVVDFFPIVTRCEKNKLLKQQLVVPFFMEIIVLMSWSIWMQRNDLIFKVIQPSSDSCLQHFKKEFVLVILRAKSRHKENMSLWLDTLV